MGDHDPMCNAAAPTMSDLFCDCERVANIRADEREDGTSAKDWARMCREANAAACRAMDERDAARAEVRALLHIRATLEGEIARLTRERDDARAEVAALQEQVAEQAEVIESEYARVDELHRDRLADLRAGVEALEYPALRYFHGRNYLNRDAVLALFDEEADQ